MTELQTPEIPQKEEKIPFSREVKIRGKKYIFDGEIPKELDHFNWCLRVPNWEVQKKKLEELIAKGERSSSVFENLQLASGEISFHPWNGAVAGITVDPAESETDEKAMLVVGIQTMTSPLPDEYGYRNARGLGSFLLDNLGALADYRGWKIYLDPSAHGAGLSGGELDQWYVRHGYSRSTSNRVHGFQRDPQTPDNRQVISKILEGA